MKARFVILLLLLVLFTVFILQNVQRIDIFIFFWYLNAPLSLLIVLLLTAGIILGLMIAKIMDTKRLRLQKEKVEKERIEKERIKRENAKLSPSADSDLSERDIK